MAKVETYMTLTHVPPAEQARFASTGDARRWWIAKKSVIDSWERFQIELGSYLLNLG
jgi:hypothetical protein